MKTTIEQVSTLEELMDLVERDFPPADGWDWLLRSNSPAGNYFANVLRDKAAIRYPVHGATRFDALRGAYMLALEDN